jgi:hypothetical protein
MKLALPPEPNVVEVTLVRFGKLVGNVPESLESAPRPSASGPLIYTDHVLPTFVTPSGEYSLPADRKMSVSFVK